MASNENTMEEAQKRNGLELIPGTEIISQDEDKGLIRGETGGYEGMILVPQPSKDPHDPLNWTPLWKRVVVINQAVFIFISQLIPLSIAPLTPIFMKQFDKSLSQVALLTGATIIALGYANLIIIPFSNVFGRRPTSLICSIICILATIWQAVTTSYGSFLGARIVNGLGAAANESIMAVVVADVMFLHGRGSWMGLFFWSYFLGAMLGPIISGGIAEHVSYRWFFWVCTIAQGFNSLSLFFFFPETKYQRSTESKPKDRSQRASSNQTKEKPIEYPLSNPEHQTPMTPQILNHGHPSLHQRFLLLPRPDSHALRTLPLTSITPFRIATYPIILWASLALGFTANTSLTLNLTQSQVFAAPPYHFSPSQVGFTNSAMAAGAIIGLLTAGPLSDWVSMRRTRGNGGVREPEMRLMAMGPYVCATAVGMVATAVGYQYGWPWEAIVVVGYGFVGLTVVTVPTIAITYAVDCYKPIAGEIMVVATICKNTFGFGTTYWLNNYAIRSGYIRAMMISAGLAFGISLLGMVVFWIWGKRFRRWTMHSWVHKL